MGKSPDICYSTVTCKVLLNWPNSKLGQYCVLMVYCGLNNNTFKLFSREHIVGLRDC